jgi:hypothetical protein
MNGILGTLLLLLDTKLLGEQVDYVMTMKHCADSLLCIINDVLMYSKLEADKLQLDASVFQIEDVCEGVGKLLGPLAAAKSVDMYFLVDPSVPQLCIGDPGRLRQVLASPSLLLSTISRVLAQVLINLVGNSVKFTDIGGEIMVICSTTCTTCYLRKVLGATRDSPYQHGGGDHECCDVATAKQIAENSAKFSAVEEKQHKNDEKQLTPKLLTPKEEGGSDENAEKREKGEKGGEKAEKGESSSNNLVPKVAKRNSSSKGLHELAEALKSKMKGKDKGDGSGANSSNHSRHGSIGENTDKNVPNNNEGEKGEKTSARNVGEVERKQRSDLNLEGGKMGYKVHSRGHSTNEAEEAYKRNLLASTESSEFVSPRKLASRYFCNSYFYILKNIHFSLVKAVGRRD